MTSKNTSCKPFILAPASKAYLWGGERLKLDFNKNTDIKPLAESWECSVHPDGVSTVASGEFSGMGLDELLSLHPEFLGTHPKGEMPILVKLIDAKEELSIQVHPDDEYALKNEGQLGKTEMWYVLEADDNARVVYGFSRSVTKDDVRKSIASGNIEKILQYVPVKKDDIFFVPSGRVHAICSGCVIAEIQESSNVTYRLFDYNRLDRNGKTRALHVKKALDVIDCNVSERPRQPIRLIKFKSGCAVEALSRCSYFTVDRMLLNNDDLSDKAVIKNSGASFRVLLCTQGCGRLYLSDEIMCFEKGQSVFVPADSGDIFIQGKAQLLIIGG